MKQTKLITGILTAVALIVGSVVVSSTAYAGPSCCASKTTAKAIDATETAGAEGAGGVEATKANVVTKTGGKACDLKTGKGCDHSAIKGAHADGTAKLLDGETMLAKLAKCGIDVHAANTEVLAASLVERACGSYNKAQWTEMIKSARALEDDKVKVIVANASDKANCCKADDKCPMTLVAKDLAAHEAETKSN